MSRIKIASWALAAAFALAPQTSFADCRGGQSFGQFIRSLEREAAAQGVSRRTATVLESLRFDPGVVKSDRAQGVFTQTFLQFSDRMVASYRLQHGAKHLRNKASLFQRIEREFGVPGPVLVSFWGLETDFGAVIGDGHTLNSLATLAYDCRRPELFQKEVIAALKIIDRGDLAPGEMRGPWAGEMGQMQFIPSHYLEYGVDYDGDGRVNMLASSADALASGANLLRAHGWRRGEPWLEEVRVPRDMPWQEAAITKKHPRSQWRQWGVRYADGSSVPADGLPASLLLPMGRNGPAFLAYPNFDAYLEWNQSLVYATTAAYFATRLAGAGKVARGSGVDTLSYAETKELQTLLSRRGYDVGKIDGIIGENTRASVRAVQQELGMPADGYPTGELLARLR